MVLNFRILFEGHAVGAVSGDLKRDVEDAACVSGLANPPLGNQLAAVGVIENYPCALLHSIDVDPGFRRKGFGSLAIQEFEARAAKLGCHFCYCKVGFSPVEDDDPDVDQEEDSLVISRLNDMWSNLKFYLSNGWVPHNYDEDLREHLPEFPEVECWSMAYRQVDRSCSHPILPKSVTFE